MVVAVGIMVRRVDLSGLVIATLPECSALDNQNSTDPWAFRRSWVFGTPNQAATGRPFENLSNNNREVSGLNGTHIDVKTNRKVQAEERLILTCSARPLTATSIGGDRLSEVRFIVDLRTLISPLTLLGNRGNAVR